MKIFVSYSRRDAGDFTEQIRRRFINSKHDVFTDVHNISAGDIWSSTIETNISKCDIFAIIVTDGALESEHVENEVLQAQKENKTIIPCIHRDVSYAKIKWDLARLQGIEFDDKYELARNLFSRIERSKVDGISSSTSSQPKSDIPKVDNDTLSKEAVSDDKIISQTQPQPDPPIPQKQEPPSPIKSELHTSQKQEPPSPIKSESPMLQKQEPPPTTTQSPSEPPIPPAAEPAPSIRSASASSSPLSNLTGDKTNTNTKPSVRPITSRTEDPNYYYEKQDTGDQRKHGISLKILLPIIGVVVVLGAVAAFSFLGSTSIESGSQYSFAHKWGPTGNGSGQFNHPIGIAIDTSDNVYVADSANNHIQKFYSNGSFITKWGALGIDNGKFEYSADVAVDTSGNVYVADSGNDRIQKFYSNGSFITKWGSSGNTTGRFDGPFGIAVDTSGNVYVADSSYYHIQAYSPV